MSFVEKFITLCPYLGNTTIGGSTVHVLVCTMFGVFTVYNSKDCKEGAFVPDSVRLVALSSVTRVVPVPQNMARSE